MADHRHVVSFSLEAIGRVYTPFVDVASIPVRAADSDARGVVELFGRFAEGLRDIDGFDRLWLIHLADPPPPPSLTVLPPLSDQLRGVFATRSPRRPNRLGLTCVKLLRVEGLRLHVEGVDMLDGSPLLDLRPYAPRWDAFDAAWAGWMENVKHSEPMWPESRRSQLRLAAR